MSVEEIRNLRAALRIDEGSKWDSGYVEAEFWKNIEDILGDMGFTEDMWGGDARSWTSGDVTVSVSSEFYPFVGEQIVDRVLVRGPLGEKEIPYPVLEGPWTTKEYYEHLMAITNIVQREAAMALGGFEMGESVELDEAMNEEKSLPRKAQVYFDSIKRRWASCRFSPQAPVAYYSDSRMLGTLEKRGLIKIIEKDGNWLIVPVDDKNEDVSLDEAKAKKVSLSFGDTVDQGALGKSGKGIKLNSEIYDWVVKKYLSSGKGTVTSKSKALSDQKIVINKKKGSMGVNTITISPLGKYIRVHSNEGGGLHAKGKTSYFSFSGLASESVELDEAMNVNKVGQWRIEWPLPRQGTGVAVAHHPEHGSLVVTTYGQDGKVYYLDAEGGSRGYRSLIPLKKAAMPYIMRKLAEKFGIDTVNEDVELDEGKKYYVLVGKSSKGSRWEVVFGDYDKENVSDEKDSEDENWKSLRIISLGTDKQSAINAAIKKLNEDVILDEASDPKLAALKLEWAKLGTKALRAFASSPAQKEILKKQREVEKKIEAIQGKGKPYYPDSWFKEGVDLDEAKLTKEDLKKPWTLNATQWLIIKGVHQPWIAEISPFQYSRMSDRQKAAYDKKRAAEWDASARAKQEWAKAVYDAYRAKKFDLKGKDVHPDARFAAVRGEIESEKAQQKALFDKAREENFIRDTSELKVGDRVFSIMSRNYVDILKVSKKSVQISTSRGGKMKQDPRTLQWLSHDDLKKKVLGEDVSLDEIRPGPHWDPWPTKKITTKELIQSLEQSAKIAAKYYTQQMADVTANIAWAMKKGDKEKVRRIIEKHGEHVVGGQGTVNQIMHWLEGWLEDVNFEGKAGESMALLNEAQTRDVVAVLLRKAKFYDGDMEKTALSVAKALLSVPGLRTDYFHFRRTSTRLYRSEFDTLRTLLTAVLDKWLIKIDGHDAFDFKAFVEEVSSLLTPTWVSRARSDAKKSMGVGEDVSFERKAGESMALLNESISPRDKKVIDAFLDKKAMDGKKLSSNGKRLDGEWIGGRGIAVWAGGKIAFNDLGSKAAQSIQRAVKKAAPKNWIAEDVSRVSSIEEMRDELVGGELDESMGELKSAAMRRFTIPKFAKEKIVKTAKSTTPLQFRRFLRTQLVYAKRGKANAGAFPHTPNPKIIAMYTRLLKQYDALYKKLDDQGFASDEKNDRMSDLHKKTELGYFKEDVELDEAKIERAHYPKEFRVKGTGDLKGLEISGKAVKQVYQAVRYEITVKSLLTKEVLATGETLRDIIHHDTGFNFKTGGEGAPAGIEGDIKALIKKTLDADSSRWEDVELDEEISQYEIKRGEVQGDGRYMLPDSGISKHGLKHSDLIGWFANKYNMAVGWYIFEASPRDKSEFGANAVRTYSEKTDTMSIAKFNLKNGTYAFLDNKAYEDGVIKYERSSAYNRISVVNSPKAFKAFGISHMGEDVELDESFGGWSEDGDILGALRRVGIDNIFLRAPSPRSPIGKLKQAPGGKKVVYVYPGGSMGPGKQPIARYWVDDEDKKLLSGEILKGKIVYDFSMPDMSKSTLKVDKKFSGKTAEEFARLIKSRGTQTEDVELDESAKTRKLDKQIAALKAKYKAGKISGIQYAKEMSYLTKLLQQAMGEDVELYEADGYIQSELSKLGQNATPFTVQIMDASGHKTKNMTFDNDLAVAVDKFLRGRRLDLSYRQSQLKRLDKDSDSYTIKISDYDGKSTKWLMLDKASWKHISNLKRYKKEDVDLGTVREMRDELIGCYR